MRPDGSEVLVPCVPTAGNDRLGVVVEVRRRLTGRVYMEISQPGQGKRGKESLSSGYVGFDKDSLI
jgi:hypothetical protein